MNAIELSPIEQMVGKQIKVKQLNMTLTGLLMQVGPKYRIAHGPMSFEFTEQEIVSYGKRDITLRSS